MPGFLQLYPLTNSIHVVISQNLPLTLVIPIHVSNDVMHWVAKSSPPDPPLQACSSFFIWFFQDSLSSKWWEEDWGNSFCQLFLKRVKFNIDSFRSSSIANLWRGTHKAWNGNKVLLPSNIASKECLSFYYLSIMFSCPDKVWIE